jgi:ATP-dependent Clp protease ATP-binding subunit ClpA
VLERQSKKMAGFLFSTESAVRGRAAKTLHDPQGPEIDFRNTIVVFTSNLRADILVGADFLHVYKVSEGGEVPLKAKEAVMDVVLSLLSSGVS